MCLFTDGGGSDSSTAASVCVWKAEMGGGNNPEDNVRPCAH